MNVLRVCATLFISSAAVLAMGQSTQPIALTGERTPEQILNGEYPYPPSPPVDVKYDDTGLAKERLTPVPPPGVHPRILISPQDVPDLRRRATQTEAGKQMLATLRQRVAKAIGTPDTPGKKLYDALVAGDVAAARQLLEKNPDLLGSIGHYQYYVPSSLAMESLDCLISDDATRGRKVGAAMATWAQLIGPLLDRQLDGPFGRDVWRAKVAGAQTGPDAQGVRELVGCHTLGYAYDFAYNYMTDAQRATVRGLIAKMTAGRVWMGALLPHHFRNWNWIMVGTGQPLLSLAIEGEDGYDPRVYKLGVEIARDYLAYAISPNGMSTEAVGYTQFGFVWGAPFMVACARRGEPMLTQSHHRAMIDWYLHSMLPFGGQWESHGDGGDAGPAIWTLSMWRYFFPTDPKIETLWQNYVKSTDGKPYEGTFHAIEPMLWAGGSSEPAKPIDPATLQLGKSMFDPLRSSLIARSSWSPDAAMMEFECRTDSVGSSHEHADRGNFTFAALGRQWAKDSFRSIETRHHNCVLIDGLGQGYWPGPGKWLGQQDAGWAIMAACDSKDAYDWWWPKEIRTEDPDHFERFKYGRWSDYIDDAQNFRKKYAGVPIERDPRPSVTAFWKGFEHGDPRMWDEDSWPVRLPHNPVRRSFRTVALVREPRPYMLIVDDIQKDDQPHLYEWLMMTGPNTELASVKDRDLILCDATVARDANGMPKPKKGDRQLLVRVLQIADTPTALQTEAKPSFRLESFEKKDTNSPDGRTFGLDKRLVIASRAITPAFKILLLPMHFGEALPQTQWNAGKTELTVSIDGGESDTIRFRKGDDGRTLVDLNGSGKPQLTTEWAR